MWAAHVLIWFLKGVADMLTFVARGVFVFLEQNGQVDW